MAPDDRWLAAVWPFVREQLPAAPAGVLEVGCGTLGGLVPALQDLLAPAGKLVVVEWAWERLDEATARWGFARLAPPAPGAEPGWLPKHQQRWSASGRSWDHYLRDWATKEAANHGRVRDRLWLTVPDRVTDAPRPHRFLACGSCQRPSRRTPPS